MNLKLFDKNKIDNINKLKNLSDESIIDAINIANSKCYFQIGELSAFLIRLIKLLSSNGFIIKSLTFRF